MTDDLISFLASWLNWAENGAPDGQPYSRYAGLCPCTRRFDYNRRAAANEDLRDALRADFGDGYYPFGEAAYHALSREHAQHTYKPRLDWVRAKLRAVETYRGWRIGDCWFGYEATHPDYDPTPVYADDGPSDNRVVIAKTRAGVIVEIDNWIEENENA